MIDVKIVTISLTLNILKVAPHGTQRLGLGVVGGFEKRPPGTEAQL